MDRHVGSGSTRTLIHDFSTVGTSAYVECFLIAYSCLPKCNRPLYGALITYVSGIPDVHTTRTHALVVVSLTFKYRLSDFGSGS